MKAKDSSKIPGGNARAAVLSAEERSSIAKQAALARWGNRLPKATHPGELKIGDKTIGCYVLEDGTRILSREGFLKAMGRTGKPKSRKGDEEVFELPIFLRAGNLKRFISKDLIESSKPILFQSLNGKTAFGYRAELLPAVCEVFIDAREAGDLHKGQEHIADVCKILYRGFATVGIIALVDEATGYQYDRAREALQHILEAFIDNELKKWIKTFPDEFYKQIARLRNYQLKNINKRGSVYAQLTNYLIYKRLAPGVLKELKRITPKDSKGRRKQKYFQRLTEDVGHPALRELLSNQIVLMKIFPDGDWKAFDKAMSQAIPIYGDLPLFDSIEDKSTTLQISTELEPLS